MTSNSAFTGDASPNGDRVPAAVSLLDHVAENTALLAALKSGADEYRQLLEDLDRARHDVTAMRATIDRLGAENAELLRRVELIEAEHLATLAELEGAMGGAA